MGILSVLTSMFGWGMADFLAAKATRKVRGYFSSCSQSYQGNKTAYCWKNNGVRGEKKQTPSLILPLRKGEEIPPLF